jgi:NAD(P)-dependent dehydrogenase (short-subunit alcohol dehydrogenase family)
MDELRFDNRVAIVTGAARGLGREYALLLASRGAKVLVNDYGGGVDGKNATSDPAMAVVEEIKKGGGTAAANADSVATLEGGASILEHALNEWDRVDIVINNAGITLSGPFLESSDEDIDLMHAVHLRGTFNVTRPAWKTMVKQEYGRILNTSSCSVFGIPQVTPYATPKGGIIGLTKGLAREGEPHGIKVNALMPAAFTRMTAQIESEDLKKWLQENFPPVLVSPLAAWLVHEDVPCTGEIFSSGGGRSGRVVFAQARGFQAKDNTPEEIREHFQEAFESDLKSFKIMSGAEDDIGLFFELAEWTSEKGPSLFNK